MKTFLWGIDDELWLVVQNGPVQMDADKQSEWSAAQKKSAQLNQRAMHVLQASMVPEEADKVEHCQTATEIWASLESTYEGTSNIRETRIDLLMHDYECFDMIANESIQEMYSRFTVLINKLRGLGRSFQSKDLNRKILRSLPKDWLPKRTAIEEAKDLNTLSIDELIGSLLSHEHVIKQVSQDDDKRERTLVFKSKVVNYESENDLDSDFDKEFALVSRRFHQLLKYKNDQKRQSDKSKNDCYDRNQNGLQDRLLYQQTRKFDTGMQGKELLTCYKCGNTGHIRASCPQSLRPKERGMVATWSDYESGSDDDKINEEAYMAFTFKTETSTSDVEEELSLPSARIEVKSDPTSSKVNPDNFLYALENLEEECRSLKFKYCRLQEEVRKKNNDIANMKRTIELDHLKLVELKRANELVVIERDHLHKLLNHRNCSTAYMCSNSQEGYL
ncbi:unnamed protein product [Linum tenue]|uniref:CCHC-type domain-containing protein n=1 Tax=Linum tenue TaxID=586396 RepID=A0AAV0JHP8_9ROSI|nr:unnamed protein product [Linum tenue]